MLVDDEPLARQRLRRLLGAIPEVAIVGEFEAASSLLQARQPLACDVLLLDIEMPEFDGFALLNALTKPLPYVIFVTAYADYAVKAFEVAAIDYVLKPVSSERLQQAVARARQNLEQQRLLQSATSNKPTNSAFVQQMTLPMGRRMHPVQVSSIDSIIAQGNYVVISVAQREFLLRRPLAWFESNLDPQLFVRIHRGAMVRLAALESVEPCPSGRYKLRLRSGIVFLSGRTFRDSLRASLDLQGTSKNLIF